MTILEEVTALSAIADMGVYHDPEAILQVNDIHGQVLYQANPAASQRVVMEPALAFVIADIMSNDQNRARIFGTGTPLHLGDRRAAAKTGTNENFKDALTIGFTPDLASVFWFGDLLGIDHTMVSGSDAIYVAAPAWHNFMEAALKGVPDSWFAAPAGVTATPGGYALSDASAITKLWGEPSPSPTPTDYGVPPQRLTGPVPAGTPVAGPTPSPSPSRSP